MKLFFYLFLLVASSASFVHGSESRSAIMGEIVGILKLTHEIGGRPDFEGAISIDIYKLDVSSAARLAKLAWMCYSPGDAASVTYDERWYILYRRSLERIAHERSPESVSILESIRKELRLDGGESIIVKELIMNVIQKGD